MMTTLPTIDECTTVLSPLLTDSNVIALKSWRQLIHRCISYALTTDDGAQAATVANLIGDALQWYNDKSTGEDDGVICTVVESIWLMDMLADDASKSVLVEVVKCLMGRTLTVDKVDDQDETNNVKPQRLIPPEILQTNLEFPLLKEANLLPPASAAAIAQSKRLINKSTMDPILATAKQKYMKVNANMYYRQHKFNLFVEESEGYAKLLSYLVGLESSGTSCDGGTKDIRALIGAFDLDPNRVLDVALDALEWELKSLVNEFSAKMNGNNQPAEWKLETVKDALCSNSKAKSRTDVLISIIRELDGSSPRAVVHLLGFKYRYYSRGKESSVKLSTTPTTSAATGTGSYPNSLYLSTAFLAAKNVIDIHDILPHLSNKTIHSLMELYQTHCTETVTRLKKMGVISLNAKSNNKEETKAVEDKGDPFTNDPVISIFRAMLMVGEWEDAAAFLGHATVPEFNDVLSEGNCVKLEKMLHRVVLMACSLSDGVALDVCGWVLYAVGHANEDSPLGDISKVLFEPLSCLIGSGKIRLSHQLYKQLCCFYGSKLSYIMTTQQKEEDESSIDADTLAVLSTCLVPSLSLFPSNKETSDDLWSVLRLLPHSIRYKLYSTWRSPALEKGVLRSMLPKDIKTGNFLKPLDCIESEIKTGLEARSIMKRISKENIEDTVTKDGKKEPGKGRQLANTSHNNPLVVFSYILNQLESYDNMIMLMVDAFQYVTDLGKDVIGYCLLLSLGGGDDNHRSRTKAGGLNTEQWLASLETFTGAFYKKFPDVELRGLLSFITQRLKEGDASELGVLRSLIKTAGGYGFCDYDSTSSLSELQLEGRCGSRLLKLETSSFGVIANVNPRASRMLRTVLQGRDLGVIILILLSQIRQKVLYSKSESKEHVKVIGRLYDKCESVLCLLLEYISDSSDDEPQGPSTKEKFANSMPSLASLCSTYGIDTSTAWMLIRPLFRKSMFFMDDTKLVDKSSSGEPPAFLKPFSPSAEMTDSYQKLLPQSAWKHISSTLFEAFFSLTIYDIQCPSERYNIETGRLKKEVERLIQLQQGRGGAALIAAVAAAGGTERQIREATNFSDAHKKELERLKINTQQLSKDFKRQQKRCDLVHSKFEAQKNTLIQSNAEASVCIEEGFASAFLTFLLYPRFISSPEDALFCADFVKLMHRMNVPGFPTIEVIDGIVNAVTGSLYCVTEDEAGNVGIFLNEIWKLANTWRYDNDSFATGLKNTPGSMLSIAFAEEKNIGDHSATDGITHDDYKTIFSQWHLKLGSAAVGCLNSSEYMHTRSALIVLSRIVLVYPTQPKVGDKFLSMLETLQADESRPDIRATAQGYASQLGKARDDGMWKEENIAVTKARQEKEQMLLEERRKKHAQQHEDIRKETEKINREIGDGRDGRDYNRRGGRDDMRGRPWPSHQGPPPPLNSAAPVFVPRDGAPPRELHPAPQRRDGHDHGRDRRDEAWQRERGLARQHDREYMGHNSRRHDDSGSRRKRSRSPEPGEESSDRDKRYKPSTRSSASPPRGNRSSSDRRPERKTRSGRH